MNVVYVVVYVNEERSDDLFEPSLYLQKLQALKRRLREGHPVHDELENEIAIRNAGEYGEYSLSYYFSFIKELEYDFQVLKDLRLPYRDTFFQIDTLLLFPSFFLIAEVKHLTGILQFDPDFQQLIQIKQKNMTEETKPYTDPILQAKRQYNQLNTWISLETDKEYIGDCLVVLTNSNAIVKAVSDYKTVQDFVVKSPGFPFRVDKLLAKYSDKKLSFDELRELSVLLKSRSVPRNVCVLSEFGVKKDDILTGIFCPNCDVLGMKRKKGSWVCRACHHQSKDAHLKTFNDCFLLFGNEIGSRECAEFLGISSTYIARCILKSMRLEEKGNRFTKKFLLKLNK